MWSRGGRSTRGGVRAIFTQYTTLLAEHVQTILSSFVRAIRRANNAQLVSLCDLITADIVGKYIVFSDIILRRLLHNRYDCWHRYALGYPYP